MSISIAKWMMEPGTDVLCSDNQWVNEPISRVDVEKWFDALESGVFFEEYNRLRELSWLHRVVSARSWGDVDSVAGA